jgi:hypothetical protein
LALFSQPFHSRWIFDVELIARWLRLRREVPGTLVPAAIYELPLDSWEDVKGSKLKRGDFFKAIAELAAIWWRYLRPAAPSYNALCPLTSTAAADLESITPRRAA